MKRNIAVIAGLLTFALSGCGLQGDKGEAHSDAPESYSAEPTSEMADESAPIIEIYTSEEEQVIEPFELDFGNFVLEDIVVPWTEEDVEAAMNASIFSDPYSGCNRRFADIDNG